MTTSNLPDIQLSKSGTFRKSPVKDPRTVPASQEERASRYYNLREENGELKEKLHDYENEIKKMATTLMRIQAKVAKTKGSKIAPQDSEAMKELINENKELKDRMRRTDAVIKSMHGTKAICKAKPGSATKKKTGFLCNRTTSAGFKTDTKDRIIEKLSSQLKDMQTQLYSMTKSGVSKSVLGEKEQKIQIMEHEYGDLERTLKEREITHQTNKEMLEKALKELQERRAETLKIQSQLVESEFSANQAKNLQREAQELQAEISSLETQVTELAMSPFVKDSEGRLNYVKRLQERENEIREIEQTYGNINEESEKLEFENLNLNRELSNIKEEQKRVRQNIEELKNGFSKETAGKLLSAKNGDEFKEMMDEITKKGNAPQWSQVNFLPSKPKEDPNDPQFLMYEIERLTLERGQLAAELEKAQALKQAKGKIDEARITLEQKINELERKVDLPNPRSAGEGTQAREFAMGKSRISPMKSAEVDALTDFSESQVSELPPKNNLLDFLVADCIYYDRPLQETTNMSSSELQQLSSLVEVAFYNHDVKYSPARPGLMPKYSLQVSFQVEIDDAFLKHMQEGEIEVTCMYISDAVPKAFGKAYIPLKDVIDRIVNSVPNVPAIVTKAVNVFGISPEIGSEQKIIGQLRYKLRMRFDMLNEYKDYKARMEYKPATKTSMVSSIVPSEVRTFNIRVVKCERLRTKEMSRVLAPFVYYSFYKFWHTTKTMAGTDPQFDEMKSFDIPMSSGFIEYLQNAPMEVVVFDDKKSMTTRIRDTNQGPPGEIIGRTHIKLAEILTQNEKKFVEELREVEGEALVGRIEIWISWMVKKLGTGA